MTNEINYDADFDEYEALEAEAESLARNDAGNKKPVNANAPNMVPARVGTSGRAPRVSQTVVVPAKGQEKQATPKAEDKEMSTLKEEEAMMEGEEEVAEVEPRAQKWVAFDQPAKTGIINTETREIIEGFKDLGSATGMAKILNEIDSIIVSGGYQ